ncbi:MAG: glucosaminidase domain-containing protein [Saprospiraceae bacterium]
MKQIILVSLIALVWTNVAAQGNEDRLKYIEKYKDIAMEEMNRAGVPASIKLAQGILESNSGKSYLARRANNHFGMKCGSKSQWSGKTVYREDDDYDENGKLQKSCFRAYKNGEASYIAHSEFLRDSRKAYRYGFLFRLDGQDYKRWARGLKRAGYATGANYDRKLISIIETYSLNEYDQEAVEIASGGKRKKRKDRNKKEQKNNTSSGSSDRPVLVGLSTINDVKVIAAQAGETPADISNRAAVDLKAILKYNEELGNEDQKLAEGTPIFIQPKRSSFRGRKSSHKVQAGQTMYDISQMYGMKLKKLYKRNRMEKGSQPAEGEELKLRGKSKKPPRLRSQRTRDERPTLDMEDEDEFEMEEDLPEIEPELPPVTPRPEIESTPTPQPPRDERPPVTRPEPAIEEPTYNPPAPPANPQPSAQYHTVQGGETLYRISRQHSVSVEEIMRLNNLSSATIRVGQRLRVK